MGRPAPPIPLEKFALHMPEDAMAETRRAAQAAGLTVSKWIVRAVREKLERGIYDRFYP